MSVLIVGLDMQKNCSYCPLRDIVWNVCRFNNLLANNRKRPEWCPLVEVFGEWDEPKKRDDMMDDLISRAAAIQWVKIECNPYGKPTLDFESGEKVIEHLKKMPSAAQLMTEE